MEHDRFKRHAFLFVLSYAFLLRLPSEALPLAFDDESSQSSLVVFDDSVELILKRRKNMINGSKLSRTCWCKQCHVTCPVHAVKKFVGVYGTDKPFIGISAGEALKVLRFILVQLNVKEAVQYRTHDLRRGHAQDLLESGAPLWTILQAGEWRSPAFLDYLNQHTLERDAIIQAHMDESEAELEHS
jgi:hypothetical protein